MHFAERCGVDLSSTVAVGDSSADFCMLGNAGIGILFNPTEYNSIPKVNHIIHDKDLRLIFNYLKEPMSS